MLLYELIDPEQKIDYRFDQPKLQVVTKNVAKRVMPEEMQELKAAGVDPALLTHIPIIHMYQLPFTGTERTMDALKMRNGFTQQDIEPDIRSGVGKVISTVANLTDRDHRFTSLRHGAQKAVSALRSMLKNGEPVVIIPLPSSSPLPGIIADSLAKAMPGAKVLDVLSKQMPRVSTQYLQDHPMKVDSPRDYHGEEQEREALADKLEELQLDIETSPPDSAHLPALRQEYAALQNRYNSLIAAKGPFQIKRHMLDPRSRYGRAYYGWIKAHQHDVPVQILLVDDNLVAGNTIVDAVKSLVKLHKRPVKIMGFVLHKFGNEKSDD